MQITKCKTQSEKKAGVLLVAAIFGYLGIGCSALPTEPEAPSLTPSHTVAPPAAAPATPAAQSSEPAWAAVAKALEREGVLKDAVYTITVPRDDLDVSVDGMGIPTAAGIASIFYFYRCPCGKMSVAGQFVTADYEANDVVDALRQNAAMKVATVAPFLIYERPRLLMVRFQGEGDAVAMAKVLREALRWTGHERMAPEKIETGKIETEK